MFEGLSEQPAFYMAFVDDKIRPDRQEVVLERVYDKLRHDPDVPQTVLVAASLLIGQQTEVAFGQEGPGYPIAPDQLIAQGVRLSSAQLDTVVELLNAEVQLAATPEDKSLHDPKSRYVGTVDYNEKDGFSVYWQKVKNLDKSDAALRQELGAKIKAGRKARDELALLGETEVEGPIKTELEAIIADGTAAHQEMILTNLPLALYAARMFIGRGLDHDDLVQEANLALIDAAEKWDPDYGGAFSTYAVVAIRRRLTTALFNAESLIYVPEYLDEHIREYKNIVGAHFRQHNRYPTDTEVVEEHGFKPNLLALVKDAIAAKNAQLPLKVDSMQAEPEEYYGDDDSLGLPRLRPDPRESYRIEYEAIWNVLKSDVHNVLKTLSAREAQIIRLRFGIPDNKPKTLDQIGAEFGVSRGRIAQIEAVVMKKLRHASRSNDLVDAIDAADAYQLESAS